MQPMTEEQKIAQEKKWVPILQQKGWRHLGRMNFRKGGKIYDLSAANFDMLDYIEQHGCFIQEEVQ